MNISTTIKQNPVASFIILALGLSYAAFLLPVEGEAGLLTLLLWLAAVPTITAFALAMFMDGRPGASAFLRQCFRWQSPLKWYLIAIAIGFMLHFGTSVLAWLAGQISAIEIAAPDPTLIFFVLFALIEEIGWRGFALRRLLDHYSPFIDTLIVGIPWALIHFGLTLLFLPTRSPLVAGLLVLLSAFPLTWIFIKSGRNLLVATMMHFAMNAFASVAGPSRAMPETETFLFQFITSCLIVAVLLLIDRRTWFDLPAERQAGEVVPTTT